VHHYNSTQYCKTETVFSIFPFLQTNITSQVWPSRGKGDGQWDRRTDGQTKAKLTVPFLTGGSI